MSTIDDNNENGGEPRGLALMAEVVEYYERSGLPLPPIPETMLEDLVSQGEAVVTTRDDDIPGAYGIQWFVDEAVANEAPDYVLFGEDGHGLNSYGFHWYLVAGHAALFVQVPYGGIYTASTLAASTLTSRFNAARQLIEAIVEAGDREQLAPDERIIVVDSPFFDTCWTRHRAGAEPVWHHVDEPLDAARANLISET
ncbi:MAG: hypothetical protein AAFY56_05260 [Pseudomonadota bacterium]